MNNFFDDNNLDIPKLTVDSCEELNISEIKTDSLGDIIKNEEIIVKKKNVLYEFIKCNYKKILFLSLFIFIIYFLYQRNINKEKINNEYNDKIIELINNLENNYQEKNNHNDNDN